MVCHGVHLSIDPNIFCSSLGIAYFLVMFFAFYLLIKLSIEYLKGHKGSGSLRRAFFGRSQALMHALICGSSLVRLITLVLLWLRSTWTCTSNVFVVLAIPTLLFFSTFTVLIKLWADAYEEASLGYSVNPLFSKYSIIITNILVYVIQGAILVPLLVGDIKTQTYLLADSVLSAIAFITVGAGLLYVGVRLFILLHRHTQLMKKEGSNTGIVTSKDTENKVLICSITCGLAYIIRANLCVILNRIHMVANLELLGYYLICEIIPAVLLLIFTRSNLKSYRQSEHLSEGALPLLGSDSNSELQKGNLVSTSNMSNN